MCRTATRIGIAAVLALSIGVTAMNTPSTHAEKSGLVSAARVDSDEMGYAINLVGTSPEDP